ncbi:MAG: Fe-S cluster assembly sulfur transfer protein SufU [Actinomycetota bacterium]|jgi:nitrogen fixation NifU-like protein|nr:SUF system NifU family Fe-S cluster assembly protein [Actinomycetota bacterium]
MPGVEDLYREIILDHYRTPRNRGELPPPAVCTEGNNPLCGDDIRIFLDIADGVVRDVKFSGQGCSISQSSTSMMTVAIKGKPVEEVRALVRRFKHMMTLSDDEGAVDESIKLGDIEALGGVVKFPVRIKCATLGWNTLLEGLNSSQG